MGATWEVNDSSYRVSARPSSEFKADSFRYKEHQNGVVLILGKHESEKDKLLLQSAVFDREVFETEDGAKKWWEDNSNEVDKGYDPRTGKSLDNKSIRSLGGINKRVVSVHTAPESAGELYSGVQSPEESQLELINQFTRSPKEAEQLAVFPVLACNDVIDRDVDQFTSKTVKGFIDLEGPLSPLGKSFMVGHDYHSLPVGRIFDGESMTKDGVTWLKLWTYIPNTEQYKNYLENVDFGVYWAVSVGVMLGGASCSVGKDHEWGWHPWACSKWHIKGETYDPDGEVNDYGEPVPVPEGQLCWRKLEDPTDFYELSQVYLGAQYMAAFDKGIGHQAEEGIRRMAGFSSKGVRTAATLLDKSKIRMLSSKEAAKLPPLFPEGTKAAEAAAKGTEFKREEDGLYTWVGDDGLAWTFSLGSGEELCLGRKNNDDSEDEGEEETLEDGGEEQEDETEEDEVNQSSADPPENEEEEDLSKAAVIKAAQVAKLPTSLVEAIGSAPDDSSGLDELLKAVSAHVTELQNQIKGLEPKAAMGDAYIKELTADALHWYVMSQKGPGEHGVKTTSAERLLAAMGDNAELIKELRDQYKDVARARFPEAVRRSSFPENINERSELGDPAVPVSDDNSKSVKRIHG